MIVCARRNHSGAARKPRPSPGPDLRQWGTRNNYPLKGIVPTGPRELSLYVNRHNGLDTSEDVAVASLALPCLHSQQGGAASSWPI